jgi:hypothetical protein
MQDINVKQYGLDFSYDDIIAMSSEKFLILIKENTNENLHTENYVYMAYRTGDRDLSQFAEDIYNEHMHQRCMTPFLLKMRDRVHSMLEDKFTYGFWYELERCL